MVIIQPKRCGPTLAADPLVTCTQRETCAKAASPSISRQVPWHLWGLGSPSTRPASWASEVETQEVCQPPRAISFPQLCSYSACMVVRVFCGFFYLKGALAPLLLSLMTMVWLKNNAGKKSRAALSCDLKIGKPTPLN